MKDNFTKGTYKSETPNRLLKTLTIIFLYELSKYITEQVIIRLQANDDVDDPRDFNIYDHIHLNEVRN
nr:transcriptional activator RinB [Staphylococcus gallinarum]